MLKKPCLGSSVLGKLSLTEITVTGVIFSLESHGT